MTRDELLDKYIELFGDKPPFPPRPIMKTLVQMKTLGTFDAALKAITPIIEEKRNEIEDVTGEEINLENPLFKIDFQSQPHENSNEYMCIKCKYRFHTAEDIHKEFCIKCGQNFKDGSWVIVKST